MSEVAKGKLHSILRLEVSQLSKLRVSDFGTSTSSNICYIIYRNVNKNKLTLKIIRLSSDIAATIYFSENRFFEKFIIPSLSI